MQQEDDLRGSPRSWSSCVPYPSFVYCHPRLLVLLPFIFVDKGINIGVVDRILLNFQRTAGLFSNLLITKAFGRHIPLPLSKFGNKRRKESEDDMAENICLFPCRIGAVSS